MYYFIRVNGNTVHNNPAKPESFIDGEPPNHPITYFNYLDYCFENEIVRIGWPDTGDLIARGKKGALAKAYNLKSLDKHIQSYLIAFSDIKIGDVVVTPDKDCIGDIYIGTVTALYSYYHNLPKHPYECSHRVSVKWDRGVDSKPVKYEASQLNIPIRGGFWTRAFQILDHSSIGSRVIRSIDRTREEALS